LVAGNGNQVMIMTPERQVELIRIRRETLEAMNVKLTSSNEPVSDSGNSPGSRNGVEWGRRSSSTINVRQMAHLPIPVIRLPLSSNYGRDLIRPVARQGRIALNPIMVPPQRRTD
jgi:hypothetical protein